MSEISCTWCAGGADGGGEGGGVGGGDGGGDGGGGVGGGDGGGGDGGGAGRGGISPPVLDLSHCVWLWMVYSEDDERVCHTCMRSGS